MIQLEFGDALRRLRDGEALVLSCPTQPRSQVVAWDHRGLWSLWAQGWVLINDPLELVMTGTWHKDQGLKYSPLPDGLPPA